MIEWTHIRKEVGTVAYSELIKDFGRIRDYMREFYVYGFKNRSEYDAKSARSYDNERRRIESWLGEYMSFRQDSSGKNVFLSVDSRKIPRNPLYKAFKAKSFTDKDITLHFILLDILAEGRALAPAASRQAERPGAGAAPLLPFCQGDSAAGRSALSAQAPL